MGHGDAEIRDQNRQRHVVVERKDASVVGVLLRHTDHRMLVLRGSDQLASARCAWRLSRPTMAFRPASRPANPIPSIICRTKSLGMASVVSGGSPLMAEKRIARKAAMVGDWRGSRST